MLHTISELIEAVKKVTNLPIHESEHTIWIEGTKEQVHYIALKMKFEVASEFDMYVGKFPSPSVTFVQNRSYDRQMNWLAAQARN